MFAISWRTGRVPARPRFGPAPRFLATFNTETPNRGPCRYPHPTDTSGGSPSRCSVFDSRYPPRRAWRGRQHLGLSNFLGKGRKARRGRSVELECIVHIAFIRICSSRNGFASEPKNWRSTMLEITKITRQIKLEKWMVDLPVFLGAHHHKMHYGNSITSP